MTLKVGLLKVEALILALVNAYALKVGICMPSSCLEKDIDEGINSFLAAYNYGDVALGIKIDASNTAESIKSDISGGTLAFVYVRIAIWTRNL